MLNPTETPIVILSEGCFGAHASKTAIGVIRYGSWPITAILDSTQAGQTIENVIGVSHPAPIVASLDHALNQNPKPKALLIGTAPIGGGLPTNYRDIVKAAIQAGLHIISGLHVFLTHDTELLALAKQQGVILWDVRDPGEENTVTRQLPRPIGTKVITMVGSDCSVGKMTVALEMTRLMQAQGKAAQFVATGQTGIMIRGEGVPLDRVIGDFMAGRMEQAIDEAIRNEQPEWVLVEGQGSIYHPAYSGVTMSLLHGSNPDALILCHNPKLTAIRQYESVPIPPLPELINRYETIAAWIKPAKVLGIALNTKDYSEANALDWVRQAETQTDLPATDPVRFGPEKLVNALYSHFTT